MSIPEHPSVVQEPTYYDDHIDAEKYDHKSPPEDDPFGNEETGEVKYRVMQWWQAGMPVATLGIVPPLILILGLSGISWYTGYIMSQFKQRYTQVQSMGDAGELLMGPFGRELFFFGQLLFIVFLMSSHILTFSVLFNTITNHGTCTIIFGVVGLIVSCICALPRTSSKLFIMSTVSAASILVATVTTMIAIAVQAPDDVENDITTSPTFVNAFLAVTNIVFAFIAHVAFFGIMSEMEDTKQFPKSLTMLQCVETTLYIVTAMVTYCYAGPDVDSPALSSAGPVMKKVAYGLAIPTVIVAGVVFGHVASKYIYVRVFRGDRSHHMHQRTLLATGTWVGISLALWTIAWVIAESIPVFNDLLSLISSLFGSWFSYGLPAIMWLFLNKGRWFESWKKIVLTITNLVILAIACAICGLGLYVSGKSINESSSKSSWTCADNAT